LSKGFRRWAASSAVRKARGGGRLVLLCGIPGSGKTTVGRAVGARLERCVHIQTDAIRGMLGKAEYTSDESRFVYEAATSVAEEALRHRYDVILDAPFPREEFRRAALSRLATLFEGWLVVWVRCDPIVAYKRNSERAEKVPLESFTRLWRSFEPPRGALLIDSQATAPDEAALKILASMGRGEDEERRGEEG
jgi:predicted kinase